MTPLILQLINSLNGNYEFAVARVAQELDKAQQAYKRSNARVWTTPESLTRARAWADQMHADLCAALDQARTPSVAVDGATEAPPANKGGWGTNMFAPLELELTETKKREKELKCRLQECTTYLDIARIDTAKAFEDLRKSEQAYAKLDAHLCECNKFENKWREAERARKSAEYDKAKLISEIAKLREENAALKLPKNNSETAAKKKKVVVAGGSWSRAALEKLWKGTHADAVTADRKHMWTTMPADNDVLFTRPGFKTTESGRVHKAVVYQWQRAGRWVGRPTHMEFSLFHSQGPSRPVGRPCPTQIAS